MLITHSVTHRSQVSLLLKPGSKSGDNNKRQHLKLTDTLLTLNLIVIITLLKQDDCHCFLKTELPKNFCGYRPANLLVTRAANLLEIIDTSMNHMRCESFKLHCTHYC